MNIYPININTDFYIDFIELLFEIGFDATDFAFLDYEIRTKWEKNRHEPNFLTNLISEYIDSVSNGYPIPYRFITAKTIMSLQKNLLQGEK